MSSSSRTDEQQARERELLSVLASARTTGVVDEQSRAARDELVTMNQGLVRHLARKFAGPGEHLDDLVQAGNLGLMAAIDGYDPAHGTELSTFAAKHVIGEMRQQLSGQAWSMRVPRRVQDLALDVRRATESLEIELGRSPTVAELSTQLEVPADAILDALEAAHTRHAGSIDAPVDESGATFADAIGGVDRELVAFEDRQTVMALLETLPEREREIVLLTYFERLPQTEIATRLGISQMHVSRLHRRAMETMRGSIDA